MNPHTLQIETVRLKTERDDLRHLLTLALPYVEDASHDPAYKGAPVAELVRKIRGAVA